MPRSKILLAEDNQDDEVLTLRALHKSLEGVEIVVARNGLEVMDYLCATGEYAGRDPEDLPGFVLLDIKMPMMDGLETLRRIRATAHTRLLPVVILTSSDEQHDQVESYQFGANSYVRKPVKFEDFIEAGRTLGIYWLTINQTLPRMHVPAAA